MDLNRDVLNKDYVKVTQHNPVYPNIPNATGLTIASSKLLQEINYRQHQKLNDVNMPFIVARNSITLSHAELPKAMKTFIIGRHTSVKLRANRG